MAGALVVCVSCSRHVRIDETSCPFCGAAVVAQARSNLAMTFPRAVAAAAVAAAVAAMTGCHSDGSVSSFYGAPGAGFSPGGEDASFAGELACQSSAACLPGTICCGSFEPPASSCQVGPCTGDAGRFQVCAITAECPAGEFCQTADAPSLRSCTPVYGGTDASETSAGQIEASGAGPVEDAGVGDAGDASPSNGAPSEG